MNLPFSSSKESEKSVTSFQVGESNPQSKKTNYFHFPSEAPFAWFCYFLLSPIMAILSAALYFIYLDILKKEIPPAVYLLFTAIILLPVLLSGIQIIVNTIRLIKNNILMDKKTVFLNSLLAISFLGIIGIYSAIAAVYSGKVGGFSIFAFPRSQVKLDPWQKRDLIRGLNSINYLEPSYLPKGFYKFSDTGSGRTVTTIFESSLSHIALVISQSALGEKIKGLDQIYGNSISDPNSKVEKIKINDQDGLYLETPSSQIEASSAELGNLQKKSSTSDSNKNIIFNKEGSRIIISFRYTYGISYPQAKDELIKIAGSLKPGISEYGLNEYEKNVLSDWDKSAAALEVVTAFNNYSRLNSNTMPWNKSIMPCFEGEAPSKIPVTDPEFKKCLQDISSRSDMDQEYLANLKDHEQLFFGISSDTVDKNTAVVCFKASIWNPNVPGDWGEEWMPPNRTQEGKDNPVCKDNPQDSTCYRCLQ